MTDEPRLPAKSSRPSSIRRRPRSVDEFIAQGAPDEPAEPAEPAPAAPQPAAPAIPAPAADRTRTASPAGRIALLVAAAALVLSLVVGQRLRELGSDLAYLQQTLSATPPAAPAPAAAVPAATPAGPGPATWRRWLALSDLKLARQALADGRDQHGLEALNSAAAQLQKLGPEAGPELAALQRIRTGIAALPVLSPETLDGQLEQLESVWVQIAAQTRVRETTGSSWLPDWLSEGWQALVGEDAPADPASGEAGRELQVRLYRLRRALRYGEQAHFRTSAADLRRHLTPLFIDWKEGRSWLLWVQNLEQLPLHRDLTALDELLVDLTGQLDREFCRSSVGDGSAGCADRDGTGGPAAVL
jgi:hypothetical protein